MSGYVGNLSEKQATLLEQFRENVRDLIKPEQLSDDYYLTRWLRARNYDLKKSEAMLAASMLWRKQNKIDSILEDFTIPEVLVNYYPGGFFGVDKEGSPVWIDPTGYSDMRGILRSAKKSDIVWAKIHLMESIYKKFEELSKSEGKRITTIVVIYDLDKFGMKHMWKPGIDVLLEIIQLFEDHYPETLKKSYIINAPRILPIMFRVLKPFLSEETIQKTQILGSNYKEMLMKDIDADQLPKYWGGNCCDPDGDPRCVSKVNCGGDVPKEYYRKVTSKEVENFLETSVRCGSSVQLDYDIHVPNSILRWQFTTDGFDIGFGVYKKQIVSRQKASNMEQVLVSHRVNSHMVPEDGSLTCHETGIYVVRFDNTYSWTRSKTIHYIVEVLEPHDPPDSVVMGEMEDVFTSSEQDGTSQTVHSSFPMDTNIAQNNCGNNVQTTQSTNAN